MAPQIVTFPCTAKTLTNVKIRETNVMGRALDQHVSARTNIPFVILGYLQHQFLDETCNVVICKDRTFEFANTEYFIGNVNLHFLFYGYLAGKAIVIRCLPPADQRRFGRQNRTTTTQDLHPALAAGAATAAGGCQEYLCVGEPVHQFHADRHVERALAVDYDGHGPDCDEPGTGGQYHEDQDQDDRGEQHDAESYLCCHGCRHAQS
jgi:hypothetical protein